MPFFALLSTVAMPFGAAHAQDTAVGFSATRSALAQRLASDQSELANPKVKSSRRKELDAEVVAIQDRMAKGDFKTGDLVVVTINTTDKTQVDTATVRDNGKISITHFEDLSVAGVLRSELYDKVTEHVTKILKYPQVRVNFTTRVTMVGAVVRAGNLNVSPDRQLNELVSLAGGGTPMAKLDQLEIRRGGKTILSRDDSKKALVAGKTLEQVGIQPGDEVFIPAKKNFSWSTFLQVAGIVSTLLFTLITFLRYYYSED